MTVKRRTVPELYIGTKLGSWSPIERAIKTDSKGKTLGNYLCRCECGFEKWFPSSLLSVWKKNPEKRYRCRQCVSDSRQRHVGKMFNSWTIISVKDEKNRDGVFLYECRCACGTIRFKTMAALKLNDRDKECTECYRSSMKGRCLECKCKNHKNIDLENSTCELIGFCSKCDLWQGYYKD